MKKTYQQPMTIIVNVKPHLMLGESAAGTTVYSETSASSGTEVLSRRQNSVWDDEEDE
ncbi:MAG: hypothetical protein IJP74_11900 [Prevotella sp.]|nr:hypothetical protein [Prevotella sp.]